MSAEEVMPIEAPEGPYFDASGGVVSWEKYLESENHEAQEYLDSLDKDKPRGLYYRPTSILALIAVDGRPDIPRYDVDWKTGLAMKDRKVITAFLDELDVVRGVIYQPRVRLRQASRNHPRPVESLHPAQPHYGLTGKAFRELPILSSVIATRRGNRRVSQTPKNK